MNVVGNKEGKFFEIQGTGEDGAFDRSEMDELLNLARKGMDQLFLIQDRYI